MLDYIKNYLAAQIQGMMDHKVETGAHVVGVPVAGTNLEVVEQGLSLSELGSVISAIYITLLMLQMLGILKPVKSGVHKAFKFLIQATRK